MNNLLLNRSLGTLSPRAFARIQTTQRVYAIEPTPLLRFDGGEREVTYQDAEEEDSDVQAVRGSNEVKVWAHQSGVNTLAIDRFEGRM